MLDVFELTMCDMQGKVFEMSVTQGFSSESFIKTFMLSDTAADLDKVFNHMQCYVLDVSHNEPRNGD